MKLRKFLCGVGVGLMVLPLSVVAQNFADVPSTHTNTKAIDFLFNEKIVQGYKNGTKKPLYKPQQHITRAEALKLILMSAKVDVSAPVGTMSFSDVKAKDWFYPYVMKAYEMQVVKGYEDKTFKPHSPVSIVEALKMLLVAHNIEVEQKLTKSSFSDVDVTAWYAPITNYAYSKKILLGDGNTALHPNTPLTRGMFAEMVYRLDLVKKASGAPFNLATNWPRFEHESAHFSIARPHSWEISKYGELTVIWSPDRTNGQKFFLQPSVTPTYVAVFHDANPKALSKDEYFAQHLKATAHLKGAVSQTAIEGVTILAVKDAEGRPVYSVWHLPNNQFLVVNVELTAGALTARQNLLVLDVLGSLKYRAESSQPEAKPETPDTPEPEKPEPPKAPEKPAPPADVLSETRKNILIQKKGMVTLDYYSDLVVIETDTIGVGTGPVDYYYSAKFNVTLKYERSEDIILDLKKGKTSAF